MDTTRKRDTQEEPMVLTAFREERSKLERYREIARNKGLSRSASLRLHIAETIKDADREQAA